MILGKSGMVLEQQQIFIEPKGTHLLEKDAWKEEFLLELEKDANCVCYYNKRDKYKVFGLPFFNHEERMRQFEDEFDRVTGGDENGKT